MDDPNPRFPGSATKMPIRLDLPDIYNAATTFVDDNIVQGRGQRTAIYYQDQKFTYQEVYEKVNRTGNALKELGVEIEHRVLLVLPDSPEFAFSFFGAIKIGAVPIPTNPWMAAKDYDYLLNDSRARAIIVHESVLPEIKRSGTAPAFLNISSSSASRSAKRFPTRVLSIKLPINLRRKGRAKTMYASGPTHQAARARRRVPFIFSTT